MNGIRIQLCLLWFLPQEISKNGDAFLPGARFDRFYSNYVRSVGLALCNHPGVMSFSIGNEALVIWRINGTHSSWYEARAGGFILRRINDLRAVTSQQLVTVDEVAAPGTKSWYDPGPEFALLPDVDNSNGGESFRLVDKVDYLSPHFYSEPLTATDLKEGFSLKTEKSIEQLGLYMHAAKAAGKPVAIGEFGLKIAVRTLRLERYSSARDRYFKQFLAAAQKLNLQGLLAWGALPEVALKEGHYSVIESGINPFSPTEVDVDAASGSPQRRILFCDPSFTLFVWPENSDIPIATPAAVAIANSWPRISQPHRIHSSPLR